MIWVSDYDHFPAFLRGLIKNDPLMETLTNERINEKRPR